PEGMVTLLFTDLEGSTANANAMGEEAAQDVRRRHFELVREQVERHRGREVKTMGDGFMVAFTSTRRAIQCAVDIQRAVEKERRAAPATPRVRIGLNAGEVVQDEEDLFGLMVNAAARIMAKAEGAQVLVSESVKMLLGPASGIEFRDRGERELKGFSERWRLFEVPYEVEAAASAGPQHIFVGREAESARLNEALAAALEGRGSVVAVVGEPGIGKTRLVTEFSEVARRRGAQVHWGATHESAGAPAFWPWVRAIRALNNAIDITPLHPYIERHAEDLVRVFPEVRTVVPDVPEPGEIAAAAGEAAQFRMFEAIAGYLKAVAERQPLVIVLDDLHWADKPTLLLLGFIARDVGDDRLLVIGTYRDVEVGRQHPLESILADLHRTGRFSVIDLKGLLEAPVREFITRAGGLTPPLTVVTEIFDQTEGNPFFLGEVVALMAKDGTLATGGATAIPQSVRAVVGQRLSRLGEDCNEVLRIAAVAGREFRLGVLAEVAGKDEEAVLDLLDEAVSARVVDEGDRPGLYRFHHALMQETLLGELSTTRRVRLHARVGAALEQRYGPRPERAAEIAFHYSEAASMSEEHAAKAAHYLVAAAGHAESQFAWGEAARLYASALALAEDDPEALREHDPAWLQVALCHCSVYSGDYRTGWRALLTAVSFFREREDARGYGAIAESVLGGGNWFPAVQTLAVLEEGLGFAGDDPALRLPIVRRLAAEAFGDSLPIDRRTAFRDEVRGQLGRSTDPADRFTVLRMDALDTLWDGDLRRGVSLMQEAYAENRKLPGARMSDGLPLAWVLLAGGNVSQADEELQEALRWAVRANQVFMRENTAAYLASIALLRGDLGTYARLAEQEQGSRSYVWAGCRTAWAVMSGDLGAAIEAMPDLGLLRRIPVQLWHARALRASVYWNTGRPEHARVEWQEALAEARTAAPAYCENTSAIVGWPWIVGYLDEAGPELIDPELSRTIRENFRPGGTWEDYYAVPNPPVCMLRLGAHWLVSGGEIEAGKARYQRSQAWCQAEGLPLEEGRSWLGLAQVAEIEGDTARALECLDRAEPIFEGLGANYFVDRVREQRARLI
ncbi:MAG: DUF2791 family P-loop domain-containing protein, partial [Dehalococcoidia bacterium]|nr:DUF2791 family P-loop domain-containing protein [Dehalococcoidia bacterium]